MIVVWVLVYFSFNNAKWAQVHMNLFFMTSFNRDRGGKVPSPPPSYGSAPDFSLVNEWEIRSNNDIRTHDLYAY